MSETVCEPAAPEVRELLAAAWRLIEHMERNERARDLSPFWRRPDGEPLTRAACELQGLPFEGPSADR